MTTADQIAAANVFASALTPLAVLGVGYWLNRRFKHIERAMEYESRLTATRFELYKEIGFQLNDLFAYFSYVGVWKELTPVDIIKRKREMDRHIYTYRPLFSPDFFEHYTAFAEAAFRTNSGWREDAKMRTRSLHRAEHDDPVLMQCFTQEDNLPAIRAAYTRLMDCLAENLGLKQA